MATQDDLADILRVINTAVRESFIVIVPEEHFRDPFLTIEQIKEMSSIMTFYVYRHKREIVAITSFSTKTKITDTCWLPAMHVLPEYQGRGIGTAMVEFVLGLAKDRGFKKIRLETDAAASWALDFYRKFGFIIVEKVENPWSHQVWLEKDLLT